VAANRLALHDAERPLVAASGPTAVDPTNFKVRKRPVIASLLVVDYPPHMGDAQSARSRLKEGRRTWLQETAPFLGVAMVSQFFKESLEEAAALAMSYLARLDQGPVGATADAELLRTRIAKPLPRYGLPAQQVVGELAADVYGGLHGVAGGRFFAWVIGGSLPSALAADWLTSAWDQNAHNFGTGPAAAITEEVVGGWLKEIFGLPSQSSFALVTGCQMAHFTCLAAARHALLAKRAWNVETQGLSGAARRPGDVERPGTWVNRSRGEHARHGYVQYDQVAL